MRYWIISLTILHQHCYPVSLVSATRCSTGCMETSLDHTHRQEGAVTTHPTLDLCHLHASDVNAWSISSAPTSEYLWTIMVSWLQQVMDFARNTHAKCNYCLRHLTSLTNVMKKHHTTLQISQKTRTLWHWGSTLKCVEAFLTKNSQSVLYNEVCSSDDGV